MISFFEVSRVVLERMDYFSSRFFWKGDNHKKEVQTSQMGYPMPTQRSRGLGIYNIDIQNKCLLNKWLFNFFNEEGLWQTLLRNKYLKRHTLTKIVAKPGDSHFWIGLMKVKGLFLNMGTLMVNNEEQVRFWEDKWIENLSFMQQFHPYIRLFIGTVTLWQNGLVLFL
jgi:hypothetical protein